MSCVSRFSTSGSATATSMREPSRCVGSAPSRRASSSGSERDDFGIHRGAAEVDDGEAELLGQHVGERALAEQVRARRGGCRAACPTRSASSAPRPAGPRTRGRGRRGARPAGGRCDAARGGAESIGAPRRRPARAVAVDSARCLGAGRADGFSASLLGVACARLPRAGLRGGVLHRRCGNRGSRDRRRRWSGCGRRNRREPGGGLGAHSEQLVGQQRVALGGGRAPSACQRAGAAAGQGGPEADRRRPARSGERVGRRARPPRRLHGSRGTNVVVGRIRVGPGIGARSGQAHPSSPRCARPRGHAVLALGTFRTLSAGRRRLPPNHASRFSSARPGPDSRCYWPRSPAGSPLGRRSAAIRAGAGELQS